MEQLDPNILYFLNQTIAGSVLDSVMVFITNVRNWIPVYILAASVAIWRFRWKGVRIVVAVALLIVIADQTTNQLIKPVFARPRPCAVDTAGTPLISWLRLPDGGRGGFSLPSSHAVNNFAAAAFFILLFPSRRTKTIVLSIAPIIAVTRPYLGLHYPSDVLAGAIFGLFLGYLIGKAFLYMELSYFDKPKAAR